MRLFLKRFPVSVICLAASVSGLSASGLDEAGFAVRAVGVPVMELSADSAAISRLDSPLEYYAARSYVRLSGKEGLWAAISSSKFGLDSGMADRPVPEEVRRGILAEEVVSVVSYRDSVAAVIVREDPDYLLLNYCWIENGRWVNGGQDLADDLADMERVLSGKMPRMYADLPRIERVGRLPESAAPFAAFLADVDESPEEFLLRELSEHRLVINGEIHRRKVSWDMLRRLIAMPEFPERVGTVFMELPSHRQATMDAFFAADTLDAGKILSVFRDEQLNGWWDKGEFDFICDLWRLNRALAEDKRIKVVLADYQVPYSAVTEATPEREDRNTHMADVIASCIESGNDRRGNFFLVGCGHAFKSPIPGNYSAAAGKEAARTAAAQLAERLGNGEVFSVWQHCVSSDNGGERRAAVRGGVFDEAFALNGDRPVGFELRESPFGAEPFDGLAELKYDIRAGSYADNYDGFLFLHPLADEPRNPPLDEVFSEEFVAEMKRRAEVFGLQKATWLWFGTDSSEMTRASVLNALAED